MREKIDPDKPHYQVISRPKQARINKFTFVTRTLRLQEAIRYAAAHASRQRTHVFTVQRVFPAYHISVSDDMAVDMRDVRE